MEYIFHVPYQIRNDMEKLFTWICDVFPDHIVRQISRPEFRHVYGLKCQIKILVSFKKYCWETLRQISTEAWFVGDVFTVHCTESVEREVVNSLFKITSSFDNFVQEGSGWSLDCIHKVSLNCYKFKYFSGGMGNNCLPIFLKKKKCCLYIDKVPDNLCFTYAVAASIMRVKKNCSRAKQYEQLVDILRQKVDIPHPTPISFISKFESKTNVSVNVFSVEHSKTGYDVYPVRVTRNKTKRFHANLFLYKAHYYSIRNMSSFVMPAIKNNRRKTLVCPYCLCYYVNKDRFEEHNSLCKGKIQKYKFELVKEKILFDNYKSLLISPFVIYFDIESICLPMLEMDATGGKVLKEGKHVPISVCALRICSVDKKLSSDKPFLYTGPACIDKFLSYLEQQRRYIYNLLQRDVPIVMSESDKLLYARQTVCYFCKKPFDNNRYTKCRDHCHITGKYRFALCDPCNMGRSKPIGNITVIAHGMQNYDSHFLIQKLHRFKDKHINIIPKTSEKLLTFSYKNIKFKDSYMFLAESLSQLVNNLREKGEDNFKILHHYIREQSKSKLFLRKGVFPYSFMDSPNKLLLDRLPEKESFFNDLTNQPISQEDYDFAGKVWQEFDCTCMREYMEIYLLSDVLLLADVFENFRSNCLRDYDLDPVHYFSSAHYTFDAFMRKCGSKLDYIRDVDHYLFLRNAVRGGVSMISHRYSEANNSRMRNFDSSRESKFIIYVDANNLYGWAMRQPMPTGNLRWLQQHELILEHILSIPADSDWGCFAEVDLEYPEHLHDAHSDLPLAPEHRKVKRGELSAYATEVAEKFNINTNSYGEKLLTTFFPKKRYIVHYRVLQFYVDHGLVVKKLHRALAFSQAAIMKDYIDLNTDRRSKSQNTFDSNFYKLLTNSLFGKSIERVDKKSLMKLVSSFETYTKTAAKPNFQSAKIINRKLSLLSLKYPAIKLSKPSYIGPAILDLAKLHLYRFHYDVVKEKYGKRAKLLFTDTDSLMYEVCTEDVYADIKELDRVHAVFDFSNYPSNHPNFNDSRKKVPGFFKDETKSLPITRFVGLRSKMYAYETEGERENIVQKAAKGVVQSVVRSFAFSSYYDCIFQNQRIESDFTCIRSKAHQVYTRLEKKISLSPFDDKRYLRDAISSVPYGHHSIEKVTETNKKKCTHRKKPCQPLPGT